MPAEEAAEVALPAVQFRFTQGSNDWDGNHQDAQTGFARTERCISSALRRLDLTCALRCDAAVSGDGRTVSSEANSHRVALIEPTFGLDEDGEYSSQL